MASEQTTVGGRDQGAQTAAADKPGVGGKGRAADGKFSFGNKGGPGNPFARQVAQLRKALVDAVTVERIQAIAAKLLELAEAGNVQAAKLVFSYVLGKPQPMPEPDRLDVEEWQGYKETAQMMPEMGGMMSLPYPGLPLAMVRCTKDAVTNDLAAMVQDATLHPEKYQPEKVELVMGRQKKGQPSPNGVFGDDPAGVAVTGGARGGSHGQERSVSRKEGKSKGGSKNGRGSPMENGKMASSELARILHGRMSGGVQ
jgi:hypothetical protein